MNQWLRNTFPESYLNSFSSRIWLCSTFVAETLPVCSRGFKKIRVGKKWHGEALSFSEKEDTRLGHEETVRPIVPSSSSVSVFLSSFY